jgi:hypothetical protein
MNCNKKTFFTAKALIKNQDFKIIQYKKIYKRLKFKKIVIITFNTFELFVIIVFIFKPMANHLEIENRKEIQFDLVFVRYSQI